MRLACAKQAACGCTPSIGLQRRAARQASDLGDSLRKRPTAVESPTAMRQPTVTPSPFTLHVDEAVLEDLRERLARTRFPD